MVVLLCGVLVGRARYLPTALYEGRAYERGLLLADVVRLVQLEYVFVCVRVVRHVCAFAHMVDSHFFLLAAATRESHLVALSSRLFSGVSSH